VSLGITHPHLRIQPLPFDDTASNKINKTEKQQTMMTKKQQKTLNTPLLKISGSVQNEFRPVSQWSSLEEI